MKRFLLIILVLLIASSAAAEVEIGSMGELTIPPGKYEMGIDIPSGYYDIRIKGLDQYCVIRYSIQTNFDDSLNMDSVNAFELTFSSNKNYWQGCHPNILIATVGILEIENSTCVFYPISSRDF